MRRRIGYGLLVAALIAGGIYLASPDERVTLRTGGTAPELDVEIGAGLGVGVPIPDSADSDAPVASAAAVEIGTGASVSRPMDTTSTTTQTATTHQETSTTVEVTTEVAIGVTTPTMPGPTSTTRPTTTTTTTPTTPTTRPQESDGRLVYMRQVEQEPPYDMDIFTGELDGSDERRLTSGPGQDQYPAWSPDGSKIAFARNLDGQWELWVMDGDGSHQRQVTSGGAQVKEEPAWSPDGRFLAFKSGYRYGCCWVLKIAVLDLQTGDVTEVTAGPDDRSPAWSPDGTRIAFTGRSGNADQDFDMFVVNRDGTGLHNVTRAERNFSGEAYHSPHWSHDGSRILVYYQRPENGDMLTMTPQGTDRKSITTDRSLAPGSTCAGTLQSPSWSPDERQVVFHGCDGLRIVDLDGSNLRRLDPKDVTRWRWQAAWRPHLER